MNRKVTETDFKTKAENCAKEIIEFLFKYDMWQDTFIYANGKRFGCYDGKHYHYKPKWDSVFVEDNIDPKRYFEWTSDFLSMSFEGPLYDVLNNTFMGSWARKIEEEFTSICSKYGKYYELGNAWNCGLYNL